MLELANTGTSQPHILEVCNEEFHTPAVQQIFDALFTTQDRIAERLGITL